MMKYLSCLLLAVLLACQAMGQGKVKSAKSDILKDRNQWFDGSILLDDNTELKGLVKYNDREGENFLSYDDGEKVQAFSPRSALAFEFFDKSQQRQRLFYTLDYEAPDDNVRKPLFFEMLREYKTFAVLVRFDPMRAESYSSTSPNTNGAAPSTTHSFVSQSETVYLMGVDNEVEAYFKSIVEKRNLRSMIASKDNNDATSKFVDRDALEKYVDPQLYVKMKAYARENYLQFKKQDDLLKILDHHLELLKK